MAITLHDITAEVPGYDDGSAPRDPAGYLVKDTPQWEALRRRVRRDIEDLEAAWGIHLDFDAERNEYRLQPPFFTEEERNALIAAAATVHVEGITEDLPGEVGTGVDDSTALVVLQVHPLVADLRAFIAARRPVQFRHKLLR